MNATQSKLPLEISARCTLVTLEFVRNLRGCDAESVLNCVGDATHPKFLLWVFDVGVQALACREKGRRELRFWKEEVLGEMGHKLKLELQPAAVAARILGSRQEFPRGEIEIQWTINAMTIARLIRAGELTEVNHKLTRASLAAFLERRLQ